MKIEVFRTGTHTDSAGNKKEWTEQDLDTIASKYNPAEHEAPVVIGHPKDNAPAFGWVEGLERKGSVLYAKTKDLVPEFVDMVKKGLFKKRSISLYPDMTLRHVGFLGAMPPAIKGLADVAFSDSEAMTIEFSGYRMSLVGETFQRIREWIIEKFGSDVADKVISTYTVDELKREEQTPEASQVFSDPAKGGEDMGKVEELEVQLAARQKELTEFSEKDKEKDAEMARLRKEVADEKAKNRQADSTAFCEGLAKEGKLTPAMQPYALDFMEILGGIETFEFTEGEGKVKKAPLDAFKAFLTTLPKSVEFGEIAKKKTATDKGAVTAEERLNKLTTEKMHANKDLTYSAAFAETQKENPELATEYAAELRGGE